ncbi:MAG: hypothetical protein IJQ21_11515 [Lachnospiraceae bacterium]|nr:hypothetical protein [Lachnospiraceae bacterium]
MMSDVKRVIQLLPSSYYFRWSIIMSVIFLMAGFSFGMGAEEAPDLSIVLFYCAFPALMICTQTLRIEIPFIVRLSPHRKRMLTAVPVFFQIVLQLLMWCAVLVVLYVAGPRVNMTQGHRLLFTVWYTLVCLLFAVVSVTNMKIHGAAAYVVYLVFTAALFGAVIALPRVMLSRVLDRILNADLSWVNVGSLTLFTVAGTFFTAIVYYLVLRVANRRMVNQMTMDRIK